MSGRRLIVGLALGCGLLFGFAHTVSAQGLIWNLPKDGTWVRYEGTYKQVEFRPNSAEGDLTIEWIRHLWIKSVGRETADYNGKPTPCRWIEIRVITGKPSEAGVDPGPIGGRIIKVLVPESRVIAATVDKDQIPVAYLPIVKGYSKVGDGEVRTIRAKALKVYPLISLVTYYKTLSKIGTAEPLQIPLKEVTAQQYRGIFKMESPLERSNNQATLWTSKDVPFGLARWKVKVLLEAKDSVAPRSAFKPTTEMTVEMSAHAVGTDAQSDLVTPK